MVRGHCSYIYLVGSHILDWVNHNLQSTELYKKSDYAQLLKIGIGKGCKMKESTDRDFWMNFRSKDSNKSQYDIVQLQLHNL